MLGEEYRQEADEAFKHWTTKDEITNNSADKNPELKDDDTGVKALMRFLGLDKNM